jgi:hypothetical protein
LQLLAEQEVADGQQIQDWDSGSQL